MTLADPARIDVRGSLRCGQDVSIDVNCVFEGDVELADGVSVGPNCVIRDAKIGAGTQIAAFTSIDDALVGARAVLGPYARLRPGAELADETHVGNFVEIKNAVLGVGSKANHLSYIGDADIGARVNIGAGTITCNYDGANKHRTVIEDDVFAVPIASSSRPCASAATSRSPPAPPSGKTCRPTPLVLNDKTQRTRDGYVRPVKPGKKQA